LDGGSEPKCSAENRWTSPEHSLDTAVLQAAGGGFAVAGPPGGDAELGGEDFDALLLEWVGEQARKRDAGLWAELDGPRAARDRAHLRRDVTAVKEALSEHTAHEVPVPGFAEGILVRRPDLEELIGEPGGGGDGPHDQRGGHHAGAAGGPVPDRGGRPGSR
jgi:hypothetical protein